jgi:hypothetical protein
MEKCTGDARSESLERSSCLASGLIEMLVSGDIVSPIQRVGYNN